MDWNLMIVIFEYIGTIAFAISGALIAIENRMDILGVIILGSTTAVGGGLLRDVIIHRDIPLVFENPSYLIVAIITTILVFILMYILKNMKIIQTKVYKRVFTIVDSIGLGVFVVVGANSTMSYGITNHLLVLFCSVLTAVGGGVIRDMMAAKIPVIFRKHIYCVAAIIGAVLFYVLIINTSLDKFAAILSILLVVIIRYLAYHFELNLPKVQIEEK